MYQHCTGVPTLSIHFAFHVHDKTGQVSTLLIYTFITDDILCYILKPCNFRSLLNIQLLVT